MAELLTINEAEFKRLFGKKPFKVGHALNNHPLLSVEAIADLADWLTEDFVEHNLGNLPTVMTDGGEQLRHVDTSVGEIARHVDSNGCWMVLKEIERHPDYRALLNASLDEVEAYIAELEGRMLRRMGFIFLSAPGSVTPAHIDNEHNLLLQIRGEKRITVGEFRDHDRFERELERLYAGGTTRYLQEAPELTEGFELQPGAGVCVPLSAPHWVNNGDAVSVSLSITFQTPSSIKRGHIYAFNSHLRRLRLDPHPPDQSRLRDGVKDAVWRAGRVPVRRVRGLRAGSAG